MISRDQPKAPNPSISANPLARPAQSGRLNAENRVISNQLSLCNRYFAAVTGVRMKLEGGAGAQIGGSPGAVSSVMPSSWVFLPMTRISPLELMACASMNTTPKSAELALFRSIIPACLVHIKARSPVELVELPTTSPSSLRARAWLEFQPASTPISCIPFA